MSCFLASATAIAEDVDDPIEGINRAVFSFNDTFDQYIFEPVARGYEYVTPDPVETSVTNFFKNLRSPVYMVNDLLQLRFHDFTVHTSRFFVNSSIGVLGLFDVAKHFDLEHVDQDFGLTMASYGVGPGPYIVIPLLGPSNLRDAGGILVDLSLDPRSYTGSYTNLSTGELYLLSTGLFTIEFVNRRAQLLETMDSAKEASVDYYLFIRSAYNQNRSAQVRAARGEEQDSDALDEEEYIFEDDE